MKWGVVLAGAADFAKPADKLSLNTNMALMATGSIWTRWCFVIKPKNYLYVPYGRCTMQNCLLRAVSAAMLEAIAAHTLTSK